VSVLRFAVLFTLVSTNDSEHMMPRNACFGNIICQSCYQFYEQEQAYCVVGTAVSKVSNCTCLSQSLCVCFTYRQVIVKYFVCDISLTGYKCSTNTEIFKLNFMLKSDVCLTVHRNLVWIRKTI
jgi:hypothetical protein